MAVRGRSGNRNTDRQQISSWRRVHSSSPSNDCRAPAIGRHQRRPPGASRHCWKSQPTAWRRLRALPAVLHWATVGMPGRVPHRRDTRIAGLPSMCLRGPPGVGNGPRRRQAAICKTDHEFGGVAEPLLLLCTLDQQWEMTWTLMGHDEWACPRLDVHSEFVRAEHLAPMSAPTESCNATPVSWADRYAALSRLPAEQNPLGRGDRG